MSAIHPQFINDASGQKALVVLPIREFDTIMEELEELEEIRLYDEAKKEECGEYILFSDYLERRKQNV